MHWFKNLNELVKHYTYISFYNIAFFPDILHTLPMNRVMRQLDNSEEERDTKQHNVTNSLSSNSNTIWNASTIHLMATSLLHSILYIL